MAGADGGRASTADFVAPLLDVLRLNVPSRYLLLEDELLTLVAAFVAVVALIIGAFVLVLLRTRAKVGSAVLICGPTGAGKTVLWHQLRFGETVPTVMSLDENAAVCALDEEETKRVEIVDLPGHERLRYKSADFFPLACAVVFVVDSARAAKDLRVVADALYNVLANPHVCKRSVPLLVACNKFDLPSALNPARIRTLLEGELDKLRATRSAALETLDDAGAEHGAYLGYDGKEFSFDDLPNPVDFEATCALKGDVAPVREWISRVLR